MSEQFKDKKGQVVQVGDKVISDAGVEANVVSQVYVNELKQTVLFVQQVLDPLAFSYITTDNLALQFTKIN